MACSFILSFEVPDVAARLAERLGVRLITRRRLSKSEREHYRAGGAGPWLDAHKLLKSALDSAFKQSLLECPPAACSVSGIPAERLAHRLTQALHNQFGFDVLFAHTCKARQPDAEIVVPVPAWFRAQLRAHGFTCNEGLSGLAWAVRRTHLAMRGLAKHAACLVAAGRDEMAPDQLPDWVSGQAISCWPLTDATAFAENPDLLNVGDFARTGAVKPFRECGVLLVDNARGRMEPPVVKVRDIFAARRAAAPKRWGRLAGIALEQARLAFALLKGGWKEVVLGGDVAVLPRARLFLENVRPAWVVGALPNLTGPTLWYELARLHEAKLYCVCNSAQTAAIYRQGELPPDHVPYIYMHPCFDVYGAWTPSHALSLQRYGIAADQIEVAGPLVFSQRPPRRFRPLAARPILVDYFDQVPMNDDVVGPSGVPVLYWTVDRLTRTVDGVLQALSRALPEGTYKLRIKSKKVVRGLDQGYLAHLTHLAETNPAVEAIEPRTSALTLNADSDLTIGFPFASPVVSARWYGVAACFYDVDGQAAQDPLIVDDLPVITDVEALAAWISREYRSLLGQEEASTQ